MKNAPDIEKWFSKIRERSNLGIFKIFFRDSKEWEFKNGIISHRTGRFFQIAGIHTSWNNQEVSQPIIIQQEVGILGFIIKNHKLLVYAKVEPGNVGDVQLAPTCQSTASNLDRIHGGTPPLFGEWFTRKGTQYVYDSMQSEQGTRFFRKRNRNVLLVAHTPVPHGEMHAWLDVDMVLELMHHDFLVNTDARSTLVCSPWEILVKRKPFTRMITPFSLELAKSYQANDEQGLSELKKKIADLRIYFPQPTVVSLLDLTKWKFNDYGVTPLIENPFEIFQIRVHVNGRETPAWDQPIISSFSEGYVELVCGRFEGILHFLFTVQIEAGLYNTCELGPTLVVTPGSVIPNDLYYLYSGANILAESRQSDEGGRFFQDISTYRLIDIGEAFPPPVHGFWLTLAQIRKLLHEDGWFTNEARSALSLLLKWL